MSEPRATDAQIKYIGILFDDCGYNKAQKKSYLLRRYNVQYTDELNVRQASKVISDLKETKHVRLEEERGKQAKNEEED